ncbi:hypothetical protein ACEPPU_24235 [Priestia aryabhattai]|uniref:hypothetical protein n=1 Tax=Priestia aryabhattai TaxID=412384 RepID=UPI0035ABE330
MYILQVKSKMFSGWADMEKKESVHDLTDAYINKIHQGFALDKVRIVKEVAVEVNTTVEVIK